MRSIINILEYYLMIEVYYLAMRLINNLPDHNLSVYCI